MRLPWNNSYETGTPSSKPTQLPQRWVLILGLASVATVAMSLTVDVVAGAMAGIAIVGLLHKIMD
jgi:hypothetical protein